MAWPVFDAAIVSVPAVFLTLLDEPFEMIGHRGLRLVTAVLVFETVVLFHASPTKIDWVRRDRWLIGLTGAGTLAVVFSIAPGSDARGFLANWVGEDRPIAAAGAAGLLTLIGMCFSGRSPRDQGEGSE